jgi:RNA polymerase sigma-70 factor (ECF subfamily)
VDGRFVPLPDQDPALWDRALIDRGEAWLALAARHERPGRFQIEAAIQSAHAARLLTGRVDAGAIALLQDALWRMSPTDGAAVARAVAIGEVRGAAEGLAALEATVPQAERFQPALVARSHFLHRLGRRSEAAAALALALPLTPEPALRAFLQERLDDASGDLQRGRNRLC